MSDAAIKILRESARAQEQIKNCAPAFDDILLFALERRYLGIPEFREIIIDQQQSLDSAFLIERLRTQVRLIKIDEISFDKNEHFHLPGVESVLSSMRDCGYSLVFLVVGEPHKVRIMVGLAQFSTDPALSIDAAIQGYQAAWQGNFPGTQMSRVTDNEARDISYIIGRSTECGVLTGIPSLKRKEESSVFVQGLERLIRVMRGRSYTWTSIADPVQMAQIDSALESVRQLQSDIHHLVKTNLSKGVSSGKTMMLGMFGMMGQGETDGASYSDMTGTSETNTYTESKSENSSHTKSSGTSTNEQYLGGVGTLGAMASGAAIGATVGSIIPGIGNLVGAGVGALVGLAGGVSSLIAGKAVRGGIGALTTGKGTSESSSTTIGTTFSSSESNSLTNSRAFTNTVSNAIAHQMAGGGFGSFGLSWTKTTNVGQELLNRKAAYCEELLQKHEERLQIGSSVGMWNVGHYFCAEDSDSFALGQGVLRSLFAGMDSHFEPPRLIKLPKNFTTTLRQFANLYLSFPNDNLRTLFTVPPPPNATIVANHPLGYFYNGISTPLNTQELAVSTPLARQDVEGITVTSRSAFGVNIGERNPAPSLTIGTVLDRGEVTRQKYHLHLYNLPKHLGVFGLTGSGKTNTVFNILEQLWAKHGIPFLVIEPTKAEYRELVSSKSLKDDLLVISAGIERTDACPLRLNPFHFDPGPDSDLGRVHVLTHIDRLKATFNASFPMYASMPYILEEAILEVYRERGWDIGSSSNRYVDIYNEDFTPYLPTLRDLYHKIEHIVRRKGYWIEQQMNIEAALKARLSSLMVGAKGLMFNCSKSIPSSVLFDRPTIIELKHMGDDDEKSFLMGLLVSRLYEYREATQQYNQENPLRHVLVVEEAHRLLKNTGEGSHNPEVANTKAKAVTTFVDMLAEIRAFGQGVIVVDQVPSRLNPNVIKGTAAKIVHRLLAKDDREMVGNCMGLDEHQIRDIALLETGQSIVHQDRQRQAFLCGIELNKSHEEKLANDPGIATKNFKASIPHILSPLGSVDASPIVASDVDMEDFIFYRALLKSMLAIPFSSLEQSLNVLDNLSPARYVFNNTAWPQEVKPQWLWYYWEQITDENWSFYQGDYSKFLNYRECGWTLLLAWSRPNDIATAHEQFIKATLEYTGAMRLTGGRLGTGNIANVYDQIITRDESIVAMRESLKADRLAHPITIKNVAAAIKLQVQSFLPASPFKPPQSLVTGLEAALIQRLNFDPQISTDICEYLNKLNTEG